MDGIPKKWLFVVSGAICLSVVMLIWANWWKKIMLFLMIIATSINVDMNFLPFKEYVGGANGLRVSAQFVMLTVLYIPLLSEAVNGRERIRVIWWVMVPFFLYMAVALAASANGVEPLLGLYQVSQLFQAFLIFLYLSNTLRTEDDFRLVLYAITLVLAVQGAVTIGQQYTSLPLNFNFLGGADNTMLEIVGGESVKRSSGLFIHPIILANFFVLTVPVALGLTVFARTALLRLWAVAACLLGLSAMVLTFSRGALIGLGIALLILTATVVYKKIVSRQVLLGIIAVEILSSAAILVWKGKEIYTRFTESIEGPIKVRFELAQAALDMIRDHPLLGVGFNNFSLRVPDYERLTVYIPEFRHPVHNLYLLEFSETGIAGGILFLLFLYGILRVSLKALRQSSPLMNYIAAAVISSFIAYLVLSMADWSYRLPVMNSILYTDIGMIGALYLRAKREKTASYSDEGVFPGTQTGSTGQGQP